MTNALTLGLAVAACAACGAAAAAYRFEAADVLDVSTDERLAPLAQGAPIPPAPLAADLARSILAAPEIGNEAAGQIAPLDGDDKAARRKEGARIAAAAPAVARSGKVLSIRRQSGGAVEFTDRQPPKRADADEDGELFVYAGAVDAAGYQRVEERFQQDSPGSYFVSAADGKSVFAPNGSYVVQLSPDGRWLLSMSPGDTHALLVVIALDPAGPRLALLCRGGGSGAAGPAAFKGWHDAVSFDLVLGAVAPDRSAAAASVPVRFTLDAQGWSPAAADPGAFGQLGYACRR